MSTDKTRADRLIDELHRLSASESALEAERDALREEVTRWSTTAAVIEAERNELRAEAQALREDAERYRWLRMQHEGDSAYSFSVFRPGKIYSLEPVGAKRGTLDEAIDAAREQQ